MRSCMAGNGEFTPPSNPYYTNTPDRIVTMVIARDEWEWRDLQVATEQIVGARLSPYSDRAFSAEAIANMYRRSLTARLADQRMRQSQGEHVGGEEAESLPRLDGRTIILAVERALNSGGEVAKLTFESPTGGTAPRMARRFGEILTDMRMRRLARQGRNQAPDA